METLEMTFAEKTVEDFQASWKPRTGRDGVTTVSVYRSGIPSAPAERGVEKESYAQCDKHLPAGRQGRVSGVFCAPTLGGVARWVRGNYLTNVADVEVREIKVDVDSTYVYSVTDWERASCGGTDADYRSYWKNGMTLREYMEKVQGNPAEYDPREWELLVAEENIVSVKPVSASRVVKNAYDWQDDLADIYKKIAREKRLGF